MYTRKVPQGVGRGNAKGGKEMRSWPGYCIWGYGRFSAFMEVPLDGGTSLQGIGIMS